MSKVISLQEVVISLSRGEYFQSGSISHIKNPSKAIVMVTSAPTFDSDSKGVSFAVAPDGKSVVVSRQDASKTETFKFEVREYD